MNIKTHIPNFITLLNLVSGSVAVILLLKGLYITAGMLVGLAAVLDFLDGFVAKLLNAKSIIGKELDSLADVISFGLVPALFIYYLMLSHTYVQNSVGFYSFLPYLALSIGAFSALRLAKFNTDTRQSNSFIGLPTPANAIFLISFAIVGLQQSSFDIINDITTNLWIQLLIIPVSCYLLIAEIPMMALKFPKGYGFSKNKKRYLYLLVSLGLIILFGWPGVTSSIILYVLMSFLTRKE